MAPAGTFISDAHRAHLADQADQPADLLVGLGIGEALEHRPGRQAQQVLALHADLDQPRPQLLGDERHERVQQLQDLVQHPGRGGARLGLGRLVLAVQHRLDQLEVPVAERAPRELVDGAGRLVELVGLDAGRDGLGRALDLAGDPAVDGLLDGLGIEVLLAHALVHLGEARRVPQLGREVAIALDALTSTA